MRAVLFSLLGVSTLAHANQQFIERVETTHVDQFASTRLIQDGTCIAGVSFILSGRINLAKRLDARLADLGANAWSLLDVEEHFLYGAVAVEVLPLQCDESEEEPPPLEVDVTA